MKITEPKWTVRDQKMVMLIHEYGMLTTQQITQLLFSNTTYKVALRRLHKLEKQHVVYRVEGLPKGPLVWILGNKGNILSGNGPYIKKINKNTLGHDVKISDLRIQMEMLKMTNYWKMGHQFQREQVENVSPRYRYQDVIPDALFATKESVVALEFELHAKSKSRYEKVFDQYRGKKLDYVWYIIRTPYLAQKLLKIWTYFSNFGDKSKDFVVYSFLDDVEENLLTAKVHSLLGSQSISSWLKIQAKPVDTAVT